MNEPQLDVSQASARSDYRRTGVAVFAFFDYDWCPRSSFSARLRRVLITA